jgi:hypothetical protein
MLYSEQFNDGTWSKTNATVTANTTVAPNGSTTAETFAVTSAGTQSRISVVPSGLSGTNTISIFAKADTKTVIQVCDNTSATAFVNFDLSGGAVGSTGAGATGVITALANGWYRCAATFTWASEISFHVVDSSTSARREAPATTGALFIWGAQAENGSFATSYIPTVASQVTRAADSASMIGNNFARWYTQGDGSLYGEGLAPFIPANNSFALATVRDTLTNAIGIGISPDTGSTSNIVRANDISQASFSLALANNQPHKVSLAYAVNDFAFTSDGGAVQTDTSGVLPVVNTLLIGQNRAAGVAGSLTIKRITYYPRRLANTELQGITS